jgi:hypothetical protein
VLLAFTALAEDMAPHNGPAATRPGDPEVRPGIIAAFARFFGESAAALEFATRSCA